MSKYTQTRNALTAVKESASDFTFAELYGAEDTDFDEFCAWDDLSSRAGRRELTAQVKGEVRHVADLIATARKRLDKLERLLPAWQEQQLRLVAGLQRTEEG